MSYQRERDEFIARMSREGLPLQVIELLLRSATTLNRYAEMACSSEAADRDRVPCPAEARGKGPCLCDVQPAFAALGEHETIPRYRLLEWRVEQRIDKAIKAVASCATCRQSLHADKRQTWIDPTGGDVCGVASANTIGVNLAHNPIIWQFTTQGDPRGYVLRVIPPSYAERNQGRDRFNLESVGVPNRESGIKW